MEMQYFSRRNWIHFLNRFCREVNSLHVTHEKKIQTNRTQFAARIILDKKLKDQSGALHSLFFLLFYTINLAPNEETLGFKRFYQPSYTELERPSYDFLFIAGGLLSLFKWLA